MRYRNIFFFTAASLDFKNSEILLANRVQRADRHRHAKLRQNWPIRCGDITIFDLFKDGGRRHLKFSKVSNFIG